MTGIVSTARNGGGPSVFFAGPFNVSWGGPELTFLSGFMMGSLFTV